MTSQRHADPEIWGGLECTINRVQDSYGDQCEMNHHDEHLESDIQRFYDLGIRRLRYPVLWEKVAPRENDAPDWSLSDRALNAIRNFGIDPIVTLLHHGSGPSFTSLIDPNFPERFASYATAVATRYPWVNAYTPINEPLTTARFSALYGFWYPHERSDKPFFRALLNQVKGTILAMKAIRQINPEATLVQTDDLGRAQGSPKLSEQVDFENHRRWLTFDLLLGRVGTEHPLFRYIVDRGEIAEEELQWIRENACPPDLIGINHYPLSNRFLDERIDLYPHWLHASNGELNYADVGAVDTARAVSPSPLEIYREVWDRYHRPFAVTEAHIGGAREAQMRWLHEIHEAGRTLRKEGVDFRAVTVWSLLGAFDWIHLCANRPCKSFYESGLFDLRSPTPRPTALAKMVATYAAGRDFVHPILEQKGYWHDLERPRFASAEVKTPARRVDGAAARPLLITGGSGTLGQAFARICSARGIEHRLVTRAEMDIASYDSAAAALRRLRPWGIVNTAGYVRVDDAELEHAKCWRENVEGPRVLSELCSEYGLQFVTFSSDLVFDGANQRPYGENDIASPLNTYGRSKAEAEKCVAANCPDSLIVRTSSFFSASDKQNFLHHTLAAIRARQQVHVSEDVKVSPTYLPDLVNICLDLLLDDERGLIHLTNGGEISWADWAARAVEALRLDTGFLKRCRQEELKQKAARPLYSALSTERVRKLMPDFEYSFGKYLEEMA